MPPRSSSIRVVALVGVAVGAAVVACSRDADSLGPARFPSDPGVFAEGFAPGVRFEAFAGSKVDALSEDGTIFRSGTVALRVTVPAAGDPSGSYAGGAFIANVPRDLSGYNALTFWARASVPATLDVAGLGNDNTGTSQYSAQGSGLALTTAWRQYTIPIPLAARLEREGGLFFFAEGPEGGVGNEIWFDDIQFETVNTIQNPRPAMASATVSEEVGATVNVSGTTVTFAVEGADQTLVVSPGYFTFASSDSTVATVSPTGLITLVGDGSSTITARLGSTAATGSVSVLAVAPPTTAAPTPTRPDTSVISLYSNAYTNVPVDTWSAAWDVADVADIQIAGNDTKKYTGLAFAGVEFISQQINASAMTHFHIDVLTRNATQFKVKLVDFGANGAFGGGDDSEHEITLTPNSTPSIATDVWNSLDIPLSAFAGLTGRGHLAQMILSGSSPTLYVDNIYFFQGAAPPPPTGPTVPAPTPTRLAADVIALYSNAYPNVTVDTWSAVWDVADVADTLIAGNDTRKYSNLVFAGIEFTSAPVNASAMTGFHMDIWTPDPTGSPAVFKVKLVDFGADGAFGGGDDVEHEVSFDATTTPALATGSWVGIDVPLSAFTGLVTKGHLAQMVISGSLSTLYVDNVYFYKTGGGGGSPGLVFYDGYASGVSFADFGGATNAVSVDPTVPNNGRASLKAVITSGGGYSGGALVASAPRDLSAYNALTFWARGSVATSTLKVGIGNSAANNFFNAEAIGIPLTTTFQKFIIPLPDPSKFVNYDGLFHFADGPNNYTVWFNDVQYELLPGSEVAPPTAAGVNWPTLTVAVGTPQQINPAPNTVNWTVPALPNGGKLTDVAWRWFTLTSSNPSVATVSVDGLVTGVAAGNATITATMNGIAVPGNAPVTVTAPLGVPTTIAPTPAVNPANVISLFSSAYTNQGVDTWRTGWSTCCNELVDPYLINTHPVKQYSLFNFVGIEFGIANPANTVNATTMTHFHVDVWSPNPSANLEIQLVNDPAGTAAVGKYQAGAIAGGTWVSLEIPLASFSGLTARDKLQQLLFVAAGPTLLYIDNVYFHN